MYQPIIEPTVLLPAPIALVLGARLAPRPVVESMIEQLIAALDDTDGDPDLELNGDESEDSEALQPDLDERGRWFGYRLTPGDVEDDEWDYADEPRVPEGIGASFAYGSLVPSADRMEAMERTRAA